MAREQSARGPKAEYGAARKAFAAWQQYPGDKRLADQKEDALRDLAAVAGKPSHVLHDLLVVEWKKESVG